MDKSYGALERGMPVTIPVTVQTVDEEAIDLRGQHIYFTIKSQKFDFDRDDRFAEVHKDFVIKAEVEDADKNKFNIELTAKDMDFEPGEYFFDLVIGGWRAICLPFTLTGGPTNRSVLISKETDFQTLKKPLKIIQKSEKPIVVVTDFNPYLEDICKKLENDKYLPVEVKKVYDGDRLYEFWYNNIDYSMQLLDRGKFGACSVVRKGKYVGRKFDWLYDDSVSCIIRAPRFGSRYASYGIGRHSTVTEKLLQNNPHHPDLRVLPNYIVDGINEFGLFANSNVTPLDYGAEDTVPEIEARDSVENLGLVRYILDHFKTAREAIDYIKNYVVVYPSKHLVENGETLHFLLADAEDTYVLEFIHGKVVELDAKFMTNFNLYAVEPNDDGTLYTPESQDEAHDAVRTNGVQSHGTGLERYNLIAQAYPNLNTKQDFENLLRGLNYTRAYLSSPNPSSPFWYTEAVGKDLVVNSPVEDFTPVVNTMDEYYRNRQRGDNKTWQSVHTVIYDLETKKMFVKTQEKEKEIEFSFE